MTGLKSTVAMPTGLNEGKSCFLEMVAKALNEILPKFFVVLKDKGVTERRWTSRGRGGAGRPQG